ncbi:MAG TPA: hypothetical protein DCS93_31755 [Microscillaceae bacterium]|nr:hypothetical protein [Microscillaceae bacterium]
MTCDECGYRFILSPKLYKVGDRRMQKIIEGMDDKHFTIHQLYAHYVNKYTKRSKRSRSTSLPILGVVYLASLLFSAGNTEAMIIATVLFGIISVLVFLGGKPLATFQEVKDALSKWNQAKKIPTLIQGKPSFHRSTSQYQETDLFNYGVEAIIVVDRNIYVDLLVKNKFHTQYKALIVSAKLYPQYLEKQLRNLISETSGLPILFLHDANSKGVQTKEIFIKSVGLSLDNHHCIDLGLFPEHFQKLTPLKNLRNQIPEREWRLDCLQIKHIEAIFNRYITERAEKLAQDPDGTTEEGLQLFDNAILAADLIADDFG